MSELSLNNCKIIEPGNEGLIKGAEPSSCHSQTTNRVIVVRIPGCQFSLIPPTHSSQSDREIISVTSPSKATDHDTDQSALVERNILTISVSLFVCYWSKISWLPTSHFIFSLSERSSSAAIKVAAARLMRSNKLTSLPTRSDGVLTKPV